LAKPFAAQSRSGRVVVKKQAGMPSARAAPKQQPAAKAFAKPFTMRHLWRMTLWAATAACALLVAVLASRSEVGTDRIASVFPSGHRHATVSTTPPPFDAQAETHRLADAVRDLGVENARLRTQLAAVQQNLDDITGSVTKQLAAARAASASPWPADATPEPITAANIASIMMPAAGVDTPPVPLPPQSSLASAAPAEPQASEDLPPISPSVANPREYGVDIGNAPSIQILHARWLGIRSAHPQLFQGLTPTVTLRETPRTKRIELHLIAGPLTSSEAAARLCLELAPYRLYCHPTILEPGRVALQ
jgi:hypothetical protein